MTDAIEKVARAIASASDDYYFDKTGNLYPVYREMARAAIAAVLEDMREPSEIMREIASVWLGFNRNEARGEAEALRLSLWQAMLTQYAKEVLGDE